ncbi:hypothetical protein ACFWWT_36295 [Streptomyces sp. NPDC058676]
MGRRDKAGLPISAVTLSDPGGGRDVSPFLCLWMFLRKPLTGAREAGP